MTSGDRGWLFKAGRVIPLPCGDLEADAWDLDDRGLCRVEHLVFVRCVNEADPDQAYLRDRYCGGQFLLAGLDEKDQQCRCPRCNRVLYPSKKQRFASLRISPNPVALRSFLLRALEEAGFDVSEPRTGLFRVNGRAGEVHVALLDFCEDEDVAGDPGRFGGRLLYAVGDPDFRGDIADGAVVFGLPDLVFGDGLADMVARVRKLARLDDPAEPVGPAVLRSRRSRGSRAAVANVPAAIEAKYAGVARFPIGDATRWNVLKVHLADGTSIRVYAPGREPVTLDATQLGMVHPHRKLTTTIAKWHLLRAICEGYRTCTWGDAGFRSFGALKTAVSELNEHLQYVFDKWDAAPLTTESEGGSVTAAFQAFPSLPDKDRALPRWNR